MRRMSPSFFCLILCCLLVAEVTPGTLWAQEPVPQEPESPQEPAEPATTQPAPRPGEPQEPPEVLPEGEEGLNEAEDEDSKAMGKKPSEMTEEERLELRRRRQARRAAREAEELANRVTFELSFPQDQGGGSAAGSAGSIEYQGEDFAVLSDGVDIQYQDVEISADQIDVNLATKEVVASGNVVLDQGNRRMSGVTLSFNLDTKTGSLLQGSGSVDPDFYFSGSEIIKTGENTFRVLDGVFTSCEGDRPAWSFTMKRADIEAGGYAKVRSAAMRVKNVPVLYWPYIVWPVKEDRTSGLLVPKIGYSDRRGGYLGLAYYQVLGDSYDTTFYADLYSEEYYGFGNEFRYRPTEGTKGVFQGYVIQDPETDDWRWKLNLDHETTDLPFGMRGVLRIEEFSDFNFFRDFERSIDRNTVRFLESRGFVSGNWGSHSLNILANRRETLVENGQNSVVLQRLPEVEYRLRPTQLGDFPLYLQLETSLNYLSVDRGVEQASDYGRFDLFPELSLPLRIAPWLSLKVSAGQRYTWYGDSVAGAGSAAFTGESLSRSFPFATAELVGPSFSRIYDKKGGGISKIKHVIEPRFNYSFLGDIDDRQLVPLFDEIDSIGSANLGRFALINRVLAKPRPKLDEEGNELPGASAREVFSWEISRLYSFDDEQPLQGTLGGENDQAGPISNLIRFNPSNRTNLTARADYNTLFSQLTSTSLSGTLGFGASTALGLSWRTSWDAITGDKRSDQMTASAAFDLVPRRLRLQTDLVYDIEEALLQQQRYLITYRSQCYSWTLEFRDAEFGNQQNPDFQDQDIRFSLTLKNVGTFLDLTN